MFNEEEFYPELNDDDHEEEEDDDDDDEDEDDGISFEEYIRLSVKIDPLGEDEAAQKKVIEQEGYSWDDWDFYKGVWAVEVLSSSERAEEFAKLYAEALVNNSNK